MHGNVPFGQPGHVAASYARNALETANKGGTGFMIWLMQLLMQMLMELLTRHHEQHKIRDFDATMERLDCLEKWCSQVQRDLKAEQDSGGEGLHSRYSGESLGGGDTIVTPPSPDKQREIAERLKTKHDDAPSKRRKWDNNGLGR